jgi:outer membrane protein TolC
MVWRRTVSLLTHFLNRPPRTPVRVVLAAFALLAPGGLPAAAATEPVALTLAEALALAEQQNPDLAAVRARAAAAGEGAAAVRREVWPRLGLAAGWSATDVPSAVFAHKLDAGEFTADDFALDRLNDPSAVSHLGTALAVEAPVDAFGKVRTAVESAAARARSAGAQVDEAVLDLRLQVEQAYRRAVLARQAVEVTGRALAGTRARESDVEARVAGGAALQADLLRARARRREREADLAERRGEAEAALAALARALGAPSGAALDPVEAPSAAPPLAGDLDLWMERALAARPALAAAAEAAEAARQTSRGEEKSRLPDLALWGRLQDDRVDLSGGRQSGSVGLSLRWSAFDPARGHRQAAAAAELDAAAAEARAAADQVRLEVAAAWHRARAARERLAAAAGGAEEGREALRVVRLRRLAGSATLTDELETEAAALAAELQELRAATDAALADAALARAAGGRQGETS